MDGTLEDRIAAVERALTDGDHDCEALAEGAANAERVTRLETSVEELTDRVAELEAATQALRGYVGNVRSVNEEVEKRADAALERAETAHRLARGAESSEVGQVAPFAERADGECGRHDPGVGDVDVPDAGGRGRRRCERCDRPLDGDEESGWPAASGPGEPDLEDVRDGTPVPRSPGAGPPGVRAGAETDGGVPPDPDDDASSGLLAGLFGLL